MLKNKLFAGAIFVLATLVAGSVSAAYTFPNKIDTLQEKKDVQTVLNMVVTPSPALTVDGVMGAKSIAAVKAFQTMKGLTADGLIGPMTRAALEAAQAGAPVATAGCPAGALFNATTGAPCATVAPSTVAGCAAGAMFSSTTGASCTTGVVSPVVSGNTEGSLLLQSAPVSVVTTVNQSETGDSIMAFAVKAKGSDMKIARVNVSLASSASALPWKYFTNISLYQDGTLLGTLPVTSTSLTENTFGSNYTAIFNGLNVVVSKEGTANFIVKADVVSTLPAGSITYTVGLNDMSTSDVVRGIDGMGLSQYATKTTSYDRIVKFSTSGTGKVTVVANGSNPIAQNVVTNLTNATTGIPALVFDLQNTSKYDVTLKTITATLDQNNPVVSGYYLYDGATIIASLGNPSSTTLSFINLPTTFKVAANSTKTLSIKMDVSATTAFNMALTANKSQTISVAAAGVTAIDSNSNLLISGSNLTGTATGLAQTFQSAGAVVNLFSALATATPSTTGVSGYATGTFVFKVKANGINLAKLSTAGNIVALGKVTAGGTLGSEITLPNASYTVSPDTTVSDGSEVTVTMTTTNPTTTPGNARFAITKLTFKDIDGSTPHDVATGLDNFYTNTVYAN
ncbi:MAG: peptidoglycan-binding protein [Candidatus Nomurabacteria bacterium]